MDLFDTLITLHFVSLGEAFQHFNFKHITSPTFCKFFILIVGDNFIIHLLLIYNMLRMMYLFDTLNNFTFCIIR
jgi:hypothetical protein